MPDSERERGVTEPRIHVQPFPNVDEGLWNVSPLNNASSPRWSPDGRELFYVDKDEGSLMVTQVEVESAFSWKTPEPLFSLSSYTVASTPDDARMWDLAAEGDRFIFLTSETAAQTTDEEPFNGLTFVENWFEDLTRLVPTP